MPDRLKTFNAASLNEILEVSYIALKEMTARPPEDAPATQATLVSSCETLSIAGSQSVIVQKRVHDPDYMAEYSAYYSRQYVDIGRLCTRLHFFNVKKDDAQTDLEFIDSMGSENYLGFITLRPIINCPVGASILSKSIVKGFIRSADDFPVHVAGKEFIVSGTPFMQQDNAVGACAQASIWMSLRTLRRREGDRAHDPAQITDAATRYAISGRIKPNREGLQQHQMVEAIRSAGYSPHPIYVGKWGDPNGMDQGQANDAMRKIHPYVESEIPVILILSLSPGGHAVVAIGHTWNSTPQGSNLIEFIQLGGKQLSFVHTASWIPELIINNDNSGPYLVLPFNDPNVSYSFNQVVSVIPLLPSDVFMSGEEALGVGLELLEDLFIGFNSIVDVDQLVKATSNIAIRLLIVEKRKLRQWAATTEMDPELKTRIRTMYLPRRVWILELHLKDNYGSNDTAPVASLVGFILIDPTGDVTTNSVVMFYLSAQFPPGLTVGMMAVKEQGLIGRRGIQIVNSAPLMPIRA